MERSSYEEAAQGLLSSRCKCLLVLPCQHHVWDGVQNFWKCKRQSSEVDAVRWLLLPPIFGCEEHCSREYSFWILLSFPSWGSQSHQWGLWAILESLDKYSNKCSYLHMLANFYRLFINSLLPHLDQNFWFADGDNIWISGLGVLVMKMCHSGWSFPFNWYLTSTAVNCPWDQEDRDT